MAIPECLREIPTNEIPCYIISSWTPSDGCSSHTMYLYNNSGDIVYSTPFGDYPPTCNVTMNITTPGVYVYNSTLESGIITIIQEDNMVSLGIFIFLLLLNAALFILPFKIPFTDEEVTNNIIKKIVFIFAFVILIFNTTIFITMADNAGLGITHELFVFQWVFLKALYVVMILLFWNIITSTILLWGQKKQKKRMGDTDEE